MRTSQNLITKLEEVLKQVKISNKSNTSFDKLCRANDEYNRLVRSGAIKKRGFTLRGVEDVHLHNGYNFNR